MVTALAASASLFPSLSAQRGTVVAASVVGGIVRRDRIERTREAARNA
jgi:hypothetical protein